MTYHNWIAFIVSLKDSLQKIMQQKNSRSLGDQTQAFSFNSNYSQFSENEEPIFSTKTRKNNQNVFRLMAENSYDSRDVKTPIMFRTSEVQTRSKSKDTKLSDSRNHQIVKTDLLIEKV